VELKRVLEVQPNSLEARLLNASVDTLERRFADAERELTLLQKELPNNSNVHLRTALYYQIRGFAPQAEKSFLRALELSPDSEDILTNVAQFYMLQRKTDQAVKVIADALPDAKKRAFHHELIGKVYSHAGHSTEAETAFKKALSMEPDRVDVIAELASEYINARRYDDALKQLDELLKRMPLNAKAYVMKGMIFQAKDDLNQAKESYDRALKIDPDQFAAANNLAYLLAEQGRDLEVALTWAQTARRLQPDSHVTADTLGWVQHKMGRDILARDQLQFAVSQQPDNPTYQYHLAMTYKETKQIPQAQAALKKAFGSKETFKEKSLAETALQELSSAK
jgi:Tfp pilus assembly protein PilF